MNTKEFVAMQLAKPFTERRIPDSQFIRKNVFGNTLFYLINGEQPANAGFCFDNDFMYEHYKRYKDAYHSLYPNIIITEEECRAHNRLCGAADG